MKNVITRDTIHNVIVNVQPTKFPFDSIIKVQLTSFPFIPNFANFFNYKKQED
jgi:hypothetical protein